MSSNSSDRRNQVSWDSLEPQFIKNGRADYPGDGKVHDTTGRLRLVSDMYEQGILSSDEKAACKQLVLSGNSKLEHRLSDYYHEGQFRRDSEKNLQDLKSSLWDSMLSVNELPLGNMEIMSSAKYVPSAPMHCIPPNQPHQQGAEPSFMLNVDSAKPNDLNHFSCNRNNLVKKMDSEIRQPLNENKGFDNVGKNTSQNEIALKSAAKEVEYVHHRQGLPTASMKTHLGVPNLNKLSEYDWTNFNSLLPFGCEPNAVGIASSDQLDSAASKKCYSKAKKNERERQRRLQVSVGFQKLFDTLKLSKDQAEKCTILCEAADRVKQLSEVYKHLEMENTELVNKCEKLGIQV